MSTLPNPLVEAWSALEMYSALSVLPREGRLHNKVSGLLERNLCDYNNAITEIGTLGEDAVIVALLDYLREVHEKVEREWSGEIAAGTFAAAMSEGVLGAGSPEAEQRAGALVLSLQWDSDPTRAIAWLESLDG